MNLKVIIWVIKACKLLSMFFMTSGEHSLWLPIKNICHEGPHARNPDSKNQEKKHTLKSTKQNIFSMIPY